MSTQSIVDACLRFENYGDGFNDKTYRVPSKSAFSRFIAVLLEVERDTAGCGTTQPCQAKHTQPGCSADVIDHLIYDERGVVSCRCPQTGQIRQMAYHGDEKARQTLKYHCPAVHYGFECLGRKQCYRDAGTPHSCCRVVCVKCDENNLRTIGTLPRNTYKWKRLYSARTALERINARSARDFNLHHHYIRGLGAMQLAVDLSLLTMPALTISAIRTHQPAWMHSLVRAAA